MYGKQLFSLITRRRGARSFSINRLILDVSDEVKSGLSECKPVVALESTIITHGMPFPRNVSCALEVEDVVRSQGAIPATIALINGIIKIGLSRKEIEYLGDSSISKPVKTSRRDFPYVVSNRMNGGTTVSGTVLVCKEVGISVFATGGTEVLNNGMSVERLFMGKGLELGLESIKIDYGCPGKLPYFTEYDNYGIGGVHRGASETFDISADLTELGRANVAVVSSGVKSILDIPKTLEYLETQGVFVATLGLTSEFPAFYSRSSGHHAPYCVKTAMEAARIIKSHRDLGLQSGLLFAVPVPEKYALKTETMDKLIKDALSKADKTGIRGKDVTPFLLSEIATVSSGSSLETNIALIKNNAKMAAEISVHLSKFRGSAEDNGHSDGYQKVSSDKRPVIIGGSNLDCVAHLDVDEIKVSA